MLMPSMGVAPKWAASTYSRITREATCQPLAIRPPNRPSAAAAVSICMGWGSNCSAKAITSASVMVKGSPSQLSPTVRSSR
ncbi:hypothetical protein D3C72_1778290 [compost metagenome]